MASGTPADMADHATSPLIETGPDAHSRPTSIPKPEDSPVESRENSAGFEPVDLQDGTGLATVGRKRKLNSIPARGVAHLTPDQLARKRAHDRQAQRAIRERKKGHIETLEHQVREFSSQKPFLNLQAALQLNEQFRTEDKELRQGLQAAIDILQPLLARPDLAGKQRSIDPTRSNNLPYNLPEVPGCLTLPRATPPPTGTSPFPEADGLTPGTQAPQSLEKSYADSSASFDIPSTIRSKSAPGSPRNSGKGGLHPSFIRLALARNIAHGLDLGFEEDLGFNFLLDSSQNVPKIDRLRYNSTERGRTKNTASSPSCKSSTSYPSGQTPPAHATPIKNTPPTCTLDSILLDFLHNRQREAAQGTPRQKLIGPPYPSVSSLLNPKRSTDSHPVSKVFTDILRTFPDISSLSDQVAILYLMSLLMRWQIFPTPENFDRLPNWLTPRPIQLIQPHPAWMDHVLFPRMRDLLVTSHQDYQFENWIIPFTRDLSVNWPYEAADCLIAVGDSDEFLINPVFERHLSNLSNWSLGPLFAERYSGLVDTAIIKPERSA